MLTLPTTVILFGCMHSPNFRTFENGNIAADGTLKRSGLANYYSLRIGTIDSPFRNETNFAIRLEDGTIIHSQEFTHENIVSLGVKESSGEFGDNSVSYFTGGYTFEFKNKKLISFRANLIKLPKKSFIPEIGFSDENQFFTFPIAEKDMIKIFGKPSSRQDSFKL